MLSCHFTVTFWALQPIFGGMLLSMMNIAAGLLSHRSLPAFSLYSPRSLLLLTEVAEVLLFCTWGTRAALASPLSIKFDGFAGRRRPISARSLRWRQLYNVAVPLPAHRRLLCCTTSTQGPDGEMQRVIILIPKPFRLKLTLAFLLTPSLHYLLIPSPQKCSARSEEPLKYSAVFTLSRPLFSPSHSPLCSFSLVSSFSVSPLSANHTSPSKPTLPAPNRLFCSLERKVEEGKGKKCCEGPWRCMLGKLTTSPTGVLLSEAVWRECWCHGGG